MNPHCGPGFAVLVRRFPGRARLRRAGCNTCATPWHRHLGRCSSDRRLETDRHDGTIPKSGQKFPETEELLELPKGIAPGQPDQTLQLTRVAACWHNLCSGHERTLLLPVVHSISQSMKTRRR